MARGYSNAELEDLAKRQLVTADEGQRKQMIARMQQIVATDLPLLHLYYPTPFLFRRKAFDQWPSGRTPDDKSVFVTGVGTDSRAVQIYLRGAG